MLNAGVGETQISNILAELNIPSPSSTTMKKRKREIGRTIEEVAQLSCSEAADHENDAIADTHSTGAKVVIDGGWQKRGSGRARDNMSGHLVVIGSKSKKCLNFGVAKKNCRVRKSATKKKRKIARLLDCRKNFTGSSNAMESFLADRTLQKLQDNGLKVSEVVMDDDSTTLSKLKTHINSDMAKLSDTNHVTKNFTNELYKIQKTNRTFTRKNIAYIKKCFNYAVAQNKDSTEGIRANLGAIVPHAYGDHHSCMDKDWCSYQKNPSKYSNKLVSNGRQFTDIKLKESLNDLFARYLTDEWISKLARLDCSNSIENMNHLVARKAPKSLHLSESESLDYRVSATVLQKNEGHVYMCKVNEQNNLSPGKYTVNRCSRLDGKREKRRRKQDTAELKKRRLHLKEEQRQGQEYQGNLEGISYGVDPLIPLDPGDIVEVPEPVLNPGCPSIGIDNSNVVIFDLETNGFDMDSDIIQVAAMEVGSKEKFCRYIYPTSGRIPAKISNLTGIMLCNSNLSHHGKPVTECEPATAFDDFTRFLQKYSPVVLVAHNVLFDSKILLRSFQKHNVKYTNIIKGFGDTLKLFRLEFPERKSNGLTYKQVDLVHDILGKKYHAHRANEDVMALHELVETIDSFKDKVPFYCTKNINDRIKRIKNLKMHMPSFTRVVESGVLSAGRSKSLASAGISLSHLDIICKRSGVAGLVLILKRIIASPASIVSSLYNYFTSL